MTPLDQRRLAVIVTILNHNHPQAPGIRLDSAIAAVDGGLMTLPALASRAVTSYGPCSTPGACWICEGYTKAHPAPKRSKVRRRRRR